MPNSSKNKNVEVAIISDLHFGVHGDSPMWHKIMMQYAEWLSLLMQNRKVEYLYILGDVFDNRKAVGVETMQMANDFFDKLFFDGLHITIIAGNHDSFYEDTSKTTSVSLIGRRPGVTLVSGKKQIDVWGDKCRMILCPWGIDMRQLAEEGERGDVVMGHFEISSFADVPGHLYTGGYTPEEITQCAPLVFSGHFHLRDEKVFEFNGKQKRIIITGSPYQLNWADSGSTKGVYFYSPTSGNVDFVENTISPKHIQISVGDKPNREELENNIIRVTANSVDEAKQVQSYIAELKDFGAVDIGAKINVVDAALPTNFESADTGEFDQHKLLVDYVNACDFGDKKEKVLEIIERIYATATASMKEDI